ncbi:MAG: hypothetical protein ABIN89_06805 [Chitinophagaceae bacterium]
MKKSDVKKLLQQIAKDEYTLNPESYINKDRVSPTICFENISQWALNVWECRTDEEIKRDYRLGLNPDSYIVWSFETFENIYHFTSLKFLDDKR